MGNINTLFTTNPSEILPVEAYIADLNVEFKESLGSTRFMKVACGRTSEGVNVYKVFVRQDNTSLDPYPSRIIEIRKALAKAPNCCPVKKVLVKPKYAVMFRVYQKHTLFDRLSTRPFVVYPEKIWYIFQLFKALAQCESSGVCHGDLKSQNILISSTSWLQISDFAIFKPSFLPEDNPSSFTYFFDTSRRQSCYIAPERFIPSNVYDTCFAKDKDKWLFGSLKPSMDMFSAGCIVYELICDGRIPFTYSQLCEYRAMDSADAAETLELLIQDVPQQFKSLLKQLLNREPAKRLSANAVLSGAAFSFPRILESFLFRYLNEFRPVYGMTQSDSSGADELSQPLDLSYMEPDEVIAKLKREKNIWWPQIAANAETRQFAVLIVTLITANLRVLRTIQAKHDAMLLLVELSSLCESSVAIDQVLPYFVHFMNDAEPQTRATAVVQLAELLSPIVPETYEESIVFGEYVFPEIGLIMSEDCVPQHILFAIATSLGSYAELSYKFLVAGREIRSNSYEDELSNSENNCAADFQQQQNDDSSTLLQGVSQIFSSLCSCDPMVKRCLVNPQSLVKLVDFFYKMGNGESLLTFLITFLNAKTEWRLRAAFFDSLPLCVQKRSVGMVPLIQQGLQDFEENVVLKTLGCIHALILKDHLDRFSIKELLQDVVPFLIHPNEWLRCSACEILVALQKKWHVADVFVKLIPLVTPFVHESKRKTISLKSKVVLMNSLVDPIPRQTFNQIVDQSLENTKRIIGLLEIHYEKGKPFEVSQQWFNAIFPRIDITSVDPTRTSAEQQEELEAKKLTRKKLLEAIFEFRMLFLKMADTRNTAGMDHFLTRQLGCVDLSSKMYMAVNKQSYAYGARDTDKAKIVINSPSCAIARKETFLVDGETPLEEGRIIAGRHAMKNPMKDNLDSILSHLDDIHMKNISWRRNASTSTVNAAGSSSANKTSSSMGPLKGVIITHLHEHSKKVTKLAAKSDGTYFASGSKDGSVKIWKMKNVLGQGYGAARSEFTWVPSGDSNRDVVNSVGWCGQFVSACSNEGCIRWADISMGCAKTATELRVPDEEGPPIYMQTSGPVVFMRTHHGVLYGLDLRVGLTSGPLGRHEVWRKKLRDDHGLVTCSAIDPWQQSWMVLGNNTKSRNLILYDLRFREEVLRWDSPHPAVRPHGIWANPVSKADEPEVFVGFNMHGEVSSFQLSVQPARKRVFWTGGAQILSYDGATDVHDAAQLNTRSLVVCESTGLVYTGDTRGTIRKWNSRASDCEVLSAAPNLDELTGRNPVRTIFEERPETSVDPFVIYERTVTDTEVKENRRMVPFDTKPSTHHRTSITDMMLLSPELMISSSYDGVIKVWK